MPSSHPPAAIKRVLGQGFVDYTITRRLPKILADVKESIGNHKKLDAAQGLLQAIVEGKEIDIGLFARPTDYWDRYLDGIDGSAWRDLPFFDLEFLFYHGLNSIAGYFDQGVDVFKLIRQAALAEAIPKVDVGLADLEPLSGTDLLAAIFRCSLFANEADYSQLITAQSNSTLWNERVLIDESHLLISHLQQILSHGEIYVIADNAGRELCWDLMMVDAILRLFSEVKIFVHGKPWPMFVSDALPTDVENTIQAFTHSDLSENIRRIGKRLGAAIDHDRLQIETCADWGEPRHFNALNQTLNTRLSHALSVISKGDLNYRRFVQDRQWPVDTPVETVTSDVPFKAFAFRVLKSDAIVGIERSISEEISKKIDDWKTCGYFAVVQSL